VSFNPVFILMIVVIISVGVSPVRGDDLVSRTFKWGTVGRAQGLAFTANGGDFIGISFNPANSATIKGSQFVSEFTQLTQNEINISSGALGGAVRTGNFVHGLAFFRATDLEFDFSQEFAVTSDGLGVDVADDIWYYNGAWNITDNAHVAANVKYFTFARDVEGASADGLGLDLGYMQFLGEQWTFGAAVNNLVGTLDFDSGESEDIPLELRAGTRYRFFPGLSSEFDVVWGDEAGLRSLNLGGEWWVWKRFRDPDPELRRPYFRYMQRQAADRIQFGLALRGGIDSKFTGDEETNFTAGIGMQFGNGHLDYAFQGRDEFENQHFFSFSSSFGGIAGSDGVLGVDREQKQRNQSYRQSRSGRRGTTTGRTSFSQASVNVGLLHWQTGPNVKFEPGGLKTQLNRYSGYSVSIYSENREIEDALYEDSLSPAQRRNLFSKVGEQYLITGSIRMNDGRLVAGAVIESLDHRRVFRVTGRQKRKILQKLANRIHRYVRDRWRANVSFQEDSNSSVESRAATDKVNLALLQWDVDDRFQFSPGQIEPEINVASGVEPTVYKKNRSLERLIQQNAISQEKYRQLLERSNQDYLVTGEIAVSRNQYQATAYLVNEQTRRAIQVRNSNLRGLVREIGTRIRNRITAGKRRGDPPRQYTKSP